MFEVGDKIVYPYQGVGKIDGIEEQEIAGQKMTCYVLHILEKKLKIVLPVVNAVKVGLRPIIREDEVDEVLEILKQEMDEMPNKWNKRWNMNYKKFRTGSIYEIAEVFKNLTCLEKNKVLSLKERRMLDDARELIVSEIAHSRKIGLVQAEFLLYKSCCHA
ncbi:CarD family transcriptional regulator [candidate division KSB3 bacterium]|uniref:CarD family transcriptional regulator n=1 Tax=candidate division KSB3 bacterium TaxID=2044937 RepID=A0A2G6K7B3_9BACT|nr:MAG: CarD family transcriptional regulator [candidate division KSB3 bacterium]